MSRLRLKLSGLLATALLVGLTFGTPLVLLQAGPTFWTRGSLPSAWSPSAVWSLLLRPDDGTLFVLLLVGIGWMSWALLSILVGVEVVALARGVRAPHLPGLPQGAVRRLVATAMLLFLAAPQFPTAVATAAPADPVAVTQPVAPDAAVAPVEKPPAATREQASTVDHVVQRGESLWSIAARHLGSGHRYPEIVALNHDLLGGRPDFLRPGWLLHLPAATAAPAASTSYTVTRGDTLSGIAEEVLGDAEAYPAIVEASRTIEQPGGRRLSDPDVIDVGWTLTIPQRAADAEAAAPEPAAEAEAPTSIRLAPVPVTLPAATPDAPPQAQTQVHAEPAAAPAGAADPDVAEPEDSPAWLLASLSGAGVGLAASLWLVLRRRRLAQFRARRPGRMIASTPPELAPVEMTLATVGRAAAPTVEFLDTALRRLAHRCAGLGRRMPAVVAVQLGATHVVLHLSDSETTPPSPWEASADGTTWRLSADTDPADVGELDVDLPAPYPLLVTWGTADDGSRWTVNLEQVGVLDVSGPTDLAADFARYLVAEVAVNPWSRDAGVRCGGLGTGVSHLNPRRVTVFDPDDLPATAGDLLADSLVALDRNRDATSDALADLPTARAHQLGEELWEARLLVCSAQDPSREFSELSELFGLVTSHPASTGTAILAYNNTTTTAPAWKVELGSNRRLHGVGPVPDLAAVGLSVEDAEGCALLLGQAGAVDSEIPDLPDEGLANVAGQLHADLVVARDGEPQERCGSLLPAPDEAYLAVTAATTDDLAALAPHVPQHVSEAVEESDAELDVDLRAWHSDTCDLPRLSVLGPVSVRIAPTGNRDHSQGRTPQLIDMVAYLTSRPNGATTAEVAHAMSSPEPRVRKNTSLLRGWLGINPRTGQPHVPDARHSRAASARHEPAYEVQDVLVDADLFRRLRIRAQARGAAGIADLEDALSLVRGTPYEELRMHGGAWLFQGDRLDHILQVAIADVAHTVATARLLEGDTVAARAAAETALKAVPGDETAQLDLAAVLTAEGRSAAAARHVRQRVTSRSDDEDPLASELSTRTRLLIDSHSWLRDDDRSAV